MSLNERIAEIIEYSKLSASEFADAVEVQRSSISHITSGRNKPSLDFLIKVKNYLPQLEWDWLIKGEGEMLTSDKTAEEEAEAKAKPTSLPDLFSLIDDDEFGNTESEDRTRREFPQEEAQRDFPKPKLDPVAGNLSDSQRLETKENAGLKNNADNQTDKVKRIVLFFESGKFESYEP
ncbi:MAG: helix-turn-helix transcriptional regulator [Chryseobacterium sp.]|nr:helix-turn-helix transcriptional regulator [Chryseobacterium sp.]